MYTDDKLTCATWCEMNKLASQFIHILHHKDLEDYTLNYVYYDEDKKCWVIEYSSGGFAAYPFRYEPYNVYRHFFTEERLREFLKCVQ